MFSKTDESYVFHSIGTSEHNYDDWNVTTSPTCTTEGVKERTCIVCGNKVTEVIPATGHKEETIPGKAPTCTEAGNSAYWYCDRCEKYFSDANGTKEIEENSWVIPATGHDYGEPTYKWANDNSKVSASVICATCGHKESEEVDTTSKTTDPTCTEAGKTVYTSKEFKNELFKVQTKEIAIPATGHTWGDWEVKTPATELIEGVEERTCSVCGKKETRAIPVHGHEHVLRKVEAVAASCETAGNKEYWTCSICGKYFSDAEGKNEINEADTVVAALGHSYGKPEYIWAEGNTSVKAKATCTVCGKKLTENVDATGVTTDPTCTEAGKTVYTSKEFKNELFKVQTKEVTIEALGHDYQTVEGTAVEATCTEAGKEADQKCSRCGDVIKGVVIPATGHSLGDVEYIWADDNSVIARATCTICGKRISENVDSTSVTTEPTCTEAGKTVYTSGAFEDEAFEVQTKEVAGAPALGHDWGEWTVTKEATVTEEGEKVRECNRCLEKETAAIPTSGSDPNQKGTDGTAVGPGASAAAAEKAITNMTSDSDPAGALFGKLQLRSPKQTNNSITLQWTKVSSAKKYVIYANKCGKTNKPKKLATITGASNVKKTFKKVNKKALTKGTYYKFIIVALDKNNEVVSTSKLIHVATKGGKVGNHKGVTVTTSVLNKAKALKKGKTLKLNAKAVAQSSKLTVKKHVAVRYESSNKTIATVSKSGAVKAVKKGTCYVYAYAQNGVFKKIKVVVK